MGHETESAYIKALPVKYDRNAWILRKKRQKDLVKHNQADCYARQPMKSAIYKASLGLLLLCACQGPLQAPLETSERPYVLVLGSAQDAGVPQIGCDCKRCTLARAQPQKKRLVSSVLLVDPANARRFLFDATPDLADQVERAKGHPASRTQRSGRPPLFDGIFITHAHMGHYSGLLQLGHEAYGTKGQKLYCTASFADFLKGNTPWKQMLQQGAFDLAIQEPGLRVQLSEDLTVRAILVPHRDEYSDTVGYIIESPRAALLFLPDIDKWERWQGTRIEDVIATVDYALVDGTFFREGEMPGRSMEGIPHPFVSESMQRFASLGPTERAKIFFTHLNHTNPASDEKSPEAAAIHAAGFRLALDGMRFEL